MVRCCLAVLLAACANAPSGPQPADVPAACRALVAADPADWPAHWHAVLAIGPRAGAPGLVRALQEQPEAPGTEAGLMLLGRFGGASARSYLEAVLKGGGLHAGDAALALGRLGDPESVPLLRATLGAREKSPLLRTSAAAALIDLGQGRSVAPFVEAVFLAATPTGVLASRREGLPPDKSRWAHERFLLIEALRRRYGEDFGLDEDAPWPELEAGAALAKARLVR